ncbi:PAS domain S-box protein [bacterium]|nr:PAS domain S-box protein [bacterium]
MKIAHKILIAILVTGLLLGGIGLLFQSLSISPYITFCVLLVFTLGIGYLSTIWVAAPVTRFVHEIQTQHQEFYEALIDISDDNEIMQLSRLNNALLDSLKDTKKKLETLLEENAAHTIHEKDIKKQEEHFRRLFEYANDAVFIYDFEGKLLDVNKKACQMLKYTRKELMEIPFLDLQIEEEVSKSKAGFQTSQKTGSLRYESFMQTKEGERIIIEVSSSIVDLKKGIMQSVVTNITERKEMEKSLKDSEEKFRTFMETANDMMFISNEQGVLTYVNSAMVRALGFSRKELLGMPFHDLLANESLSVSKQRREQLLSGGEDFHELIWESKTRKKIIGEMKATGIFDDEGHFKGMRGVFRDMTERKKIEASQRLTQLGRLAADIAHEVKNQLMLVSTRAQIALIHLQEAKEVETDIQTIIDQCKRINDVVKRLLQFSRPSKGDFQEVDLNNSLQFVIDLVEKQFFQGKVEILKKLAPSLPTVNIDEKQMQEVFVNLLQNAYEAMPEGGLITVSTSTRDDFVQIDFKDTGAGISENDMARIFDPFFTTKENGTGLGLSACFGIVQAHQGNLHYESEPGNGTTATILLPAQ